ncbi:MAG: hypothetical protein Kow0010_15410 [Dehalococcoidia bacterium]
MVMAAAAAWALAWTGPSATAAAAVLLLLAGAALIVGTVAWPANEPSEGLRLVVRLRRLIAGVVAGMLGAGLAFEAPFLVAAAVVIAIEETIEVGIVMWALRHEPG